MGTTNKISSPSESATPDWRRLVLRALAIVLIAALVTAGALPIALSTDGEFGAAAVGIAGLVCVVSSLAAAIAATLLHRPQLVMQQVLATTALRMAPPLLLCLILYVRGGVLVDADIAWYVMAYYGALWLADLSLTTLFQRRHSATGGGGETDVSTIA